VLFIVIGEATEDKHRVILKFLRVKGEVFSHGNFALPAFKFSPIGFDLQVIKKRGQRLLKAKFRFVINRCFSQFFGKPL